MAKTITEGDISRLRKSVHELLGIDKKEIDLSKIPIGELLNIGKTKDAPEESLAQVESSLMGLDLKPSTQEIERLARQARLAKTNLEDFFNRPSDSPYEVPPVPLVLEGTPGIKEKGLIWKEKVPEEMSTEYLQKALPDLIEKSITPKKKTFEDLTEDEINMAKDYFRSLGSNVSSKEEFEKKAGSDLKLFKDFLGFLKNKKAAKETQKQPPPVEVKIIKDEVTGEEVHDLGEL